MAVTLAVLFTAIAVSGWAAKFNLLDIVAVTNAHGWFAAIVVFVMVLPGAVSFVLNFLIEGAWKLLLWFSMSALFYVVWWVIFYHSHVR